MKWYNILISGIVIFIIMSCSVDSLKLFDSQSPLNQNNTDAEVNTKSSDSNSEIVVQITDPKQAESLAHTLGAKIVMRLSIRNAHYIKITGSNKSLADIRSYEEVLDAEYEQYRKNYTIPNDTYYEGQYAPQLTELEDVWTSYTGRGVKVAVLDSGVDTTHEDFGGASAFVEGYDYIDNTVYGTTQNKDEDGHGTHVAGIIAARKDNGKGIVGIAPESTIIPYKIIGLAGYSSANIASAIKAATDAGAKVINMSLGGNTSSSIEAEAVRYALDNDVTIVVATGNDHMELINYPASYPGVIAVGSSKGNDEVSSFSTRSPNISVVAPGEDILSLQAPVPSATFTYVPRNGTSMATPFVSGLVALIKEKFPNARPAQVKKLIENTAKDLETPGFDKKSGYGRVQPKLALAEISLPNVAWQTVEFSIKVAGTNQINYVIQIRNATDDSHLYSLLTDADGKAIVKLPSGTYKYASNYLGLEYSGSFTVSNTSVSLAHDFQENEFTDYYRISTYKNSNSSNTVDTIVAIYEIISFSPAQTKQIAINDNRSSDSYSEIIFKPKRGTSYLIAVQPSGSDRSGDYIIALEADILSSEVQEGPGNKDYVSGYNSIDTSTQYRGILSSSSQHQYRFIIY